MPCFVNVNIVLCSFQKVPPLALTKSDLAALYETAISKGETLKLGAGEDSYINAAVHELDDDSHIGHTEEAPSSSNSGYYYYYYPIKSFIDELTSQTGPVSINNVNEKWSFSRSFSGDLDREISYSRSTCINV